MLCVCRLANQPSVAIRTVPPDEPTKRVDMLNVEDIAAQVASDGDVKFCRCWKSANFPFCDDSHDGHNEACAAKEGGSADNAAPVVLTSGLPAEKRGLDKVETIPPGSEPVLDLSLAGQGHANNYAVPSNSATKTHLLATSRLLVHLTHKRWRAQCRRASPSSASRSSTSRTSRARSPRPAR